MDHIRQFGPKLGNCQKPSDGSRLEFDPNFCVGWMSNPRQSEGLCYHGYCFHAAYATFSHRPPGFLAWGSWAVHGIGLQWIDQVCALEQTHWDELMLKGHDAVVVLRTSSQPIPLRCDLVTVHCRSRRVEMLCVVMRASHDHRMSLQRFCFHSYIRSYTYAHIHTLIHIRSYIYAHTHTLIHIRRRTYRLYYIDDISSGICYLSF